MHFPKFNLRTDTGVYWKTDKEPTEEETLKETLGKGDQNVCTWKLVLYWEGREFSSHSLLDFKQKCSKDLVKEWYALMGKVSRKKRVLEGWARLENEILNEMKEMDMN